MLLKVAFVENEKKAAVCGQSKRVSDNVIFCHSSSGVCSEKVVVNLMSNVWCSSLLLDRKHSLEKGHSTCTYGLVAF